MAAFIPETVNNHFHWLLQFYRLGKSFSPRVLQEDDSS